MRQLSILMLGLIWMVGMVTEWHTMAQAARDRGCCTAFSRVHVEHLMISTRGRKVQCGWQGITEHCSINAVVLKFKHRKVCVDPKPRKMKKLLKVLCNTKAGKTARNPSRWQKKTSKI